AVRLVGASDRAPEGVERTEGISNYFIGRDESKWRTDVPHFAKVRFRRVYPGIELVYYTTSEGRLEFDFLATAGADLSCIQLRVNGPIKLDANGDAVSGAARIRKPRIYQGSSEIGGRFRVDGQILSFDLDQYDTGQPIVIDPVIEYATYMGGPG